MAVLHGQIPPTEPVETEARVIIKLKRLQRGAKDTLLDASRSSLSMLAEVSEASIKPFFSEGEHLRATAMDPFDRYVAIEVANRDAATELAEKLRGLDTVEEAYVEAGPVPPPVNPDDDPRSSNQGYLDSAPAGIDARWAWPMADGDGIGFVDLEQGWTLNHEDLLYANIGLISGLSRAYHGHGTAVLGEVVAVDNARGGVGIAPRAAANVVSQWRSGGGYNTAEAILSAAGSMSAGDVLLLEAQTHVGSLSNMPVEVEAAVFDAIRYAVDQGIVVVEAAGNGGNDLDTYRDTANRRVLNRNSADFRDSGAIMVGAASSGVPHARLSFSNHGSRIDCYGWGQNIDTAGDGWAGTSLTAYTTGFGGTSGASPIVAGAAILLQSWRKRHHGAGYNPRIVRDRLSSADLNTPSADPASDRIGVMPDLRAILAAEGAWDRLRDLRPEYALLSYILIGVIDDSPGVIWVPGRGPVPVDPDWGRLSRALSAPKRDLLAAVALSEIATFVDDRRTRNQMTNSALAAMRRAVDRMGQPGRSRRAEGGLGRLLNFLFGLGSRLPDEAEQGDRRDTSARF
jgi:subtilase family protein